MPMIVVSPDEKEKRWMMSELKLIDALWICTCWHDQQTLTFETCWCVFQCLSTGVGGTDQRREGSGKGEGNRIENKNDIESQAERDGEVNLFNLFFFLF